MRCGPVVKDATYSGTSGWSPQLGGVINAGTCEKGEGNNNGQIMRCARVGVYGACLRKCVRACRCALAVGGRSAAPCKACQRAAGRPHAARLLCPPPLARRLGDVCVSPFSVSWDCRKASWSMTAAGNPNQCTMPKQARGAGEGSMHGRL